MWKDMDKKCITNKNQVRSKMFVIVDKEVHKSYVHRSSGVKLMGIILRRQMHKR